MKKNVCLMLAMLLALSLTLAACGGSGDVRGEIASTQGPTETLPGGVIQQTEATEDPETTEVPETTAPADENELSLGRMEGGVYTNTYVGYACNLDSNWSFMTAEELQQIPSNVSDLFSGSELSEQLEGVQQFTDMMAENVNDLTSVNVLYQKLSFQERLAYATLSEEAIIDATLSQKDMLIEAYGQAGMTVESMEKVTVTFMGEERTAIHTKSSIQGVPYFTLQIVNYGLGEYGVTTTLASYMEDNTANLLELFYKVD